MLLCAGGIAAGGSTWADSDDSVVAIVVTGSRLTGVNATSTSPVVVVDNEELLHQGTTKAEDLLNSLPQVNSGLTLAANGPSVAPLTGTATADLRGIGAFRTLVLINGRRTAPGDPINPSADLNTIPTALVKRVEVLTGGASAIYGSDAVSGVVNFILDTDFTGFKFDAEGGAFQAANQRRDLQAIARANGITPATGRGFDGQSYDLSIAFGQPFAEGAGHVTVYGGYRRVQPVSGSRRDFSACTLTETASSFDCLLDGTTAAGQFVPNSGSGNPLTLDLANGHAFRSLAAPTDLYNPAFDQQLQRADSRVNAGAFLSYRLSAAATLYGEGEFTDDRTRVYYEPVGTTATGAALNVYPIACNNPLLSPSQVSDLCTTYGLGPTDVAPVAIGRRNVEGGPRSDDFHHQSFRAVVGMKGQLSAPWSYDVSIVYGRVNSRETLSNDFSAGRVANALNVVNVGGTPTCQSVVDGSDPSCVPYNLFAAGGVTSAALRYVTEGGVQSGFADRAIVGAQIVGDLAQYGVRSPYAKRGVSTAFGLEYRNERVQYNPDTAYSTGDLLVTGAAHPTAGGFHVGEAFAEVHLPLMEERSGAEDLSVNLSDRYAHYSPQGNVNAYGLGIEWSPVKPLRLRGSLSRAVRAPNAYELFTSRVLGQITFADPCAGTPTATAAQCANTGVTAAEYGNIAPQTSINVLTGGNPALKPETADTVTWGIVLMPLPNLAFTADWWRIKVSQYVGSVPASYAMTTCLNGGDPFYCSLIQRDASGSLSTGNGSTAGRVVGTRFNTGSYGNTGVDLEGRYSVDLRSFGPAAGRITFSFTGSAALKNPISVTPGAALLDCTGLFGPSCSGAGPTSPVPRWRHRLRSTWRTTHDLEVSLNWRHIGHLNSEFTSAYLYSPGSIYPVDARIPAYDYFDLDASIDLTERWNARVGINNLTNRQPPVVGFTANPLLVNGNLAAGMYDPLGRYLFAGVMLRY